MSRSGRLLASLIAMAITSSGAADIVERRGALAPLEGTIQSVDDAGISLKTVAGAVHLVPWDRVRAVETSGGSAVLIERRLTDAGSLWRARSRVERHDTTLAEPLLERLFERYQGQTNETALVVAEGLLRCRLVRGANELAVIPALEVMRLRRKSVITDSYSMLPELLGAELGLCTALPPVWPSQGAAEAVARDLSAYDAPDDEVVASVARLYQRAALLQSGEPVEVIDDWPDDPGVRFLRRLVESISDDVSTRRTARGQFEFLLDGQPQWARGWMRYHMGVSLLRESELPRQHAGLVQLAHLPASFASVQPYLTGLAMARLATELARLGDADAAASVRGEMQRLFPTHPATQTTSFRSQN